MRTTAQRIRLIFDRLSKLGLKEGAFAQGADVDPGNFSKMKAGIINPTEKTLQKLEAALNKALLEKYIEVRKFIEVDKQCFLDLSGLSGLNSAERLDTIADRVGVARPEPVGVVTPAPKEEEAFTDGMLRVAGNGMPAEVPFWMWPTMVGVSQLPSTVPVCERTLLRLQHYSAGWHFVALLPLAEVIIKLLGAAHKEVRGSETRRLLFIAHAKVCHWHCFLDTPVTIRKRTASHLAALRVLSDEVEEDDELREHYYVLLGDVLKVAADGDLNTNSEAAAKLKIGLDIAERSRLLVRHYQGPRSLAITTAISNVRDGEFDASQVTVRHILERSTFSHRTVAHVYEGQSESYAIMYQRTGDKCYEAETVKFWEKACEEKKTADINGEPENHELTLRVECLITKLARNGIVAPLEASGMTMEERLLFELNAALSLGSERPAVRAAMYLEKLRQAKHKSK
ncbi:MAG: hypothetical protein ACKVP4_00970 [Hyphomicrobium sp.]